MSSTSADGKLQVVLVAIDEGEESRHSLEWAIEHLKRQSGFKIVLVNVKPLPSSVLKYSGPGTGDVMPIIDNDLKKSADAAIAEAKKICQHHSVSNIETEIVEGDARHALCVAVEKHRADMLVMGSHGYGAFKRAILGSVSDYCAHHARCSVLIVKKPKAKADHH